MASRFTLSELAIISITKSTPLEQILFSRMYTPLPSIRAGLSSTTLSATQPTAAVAVMICHGNMEDISDRLDIFAEYQSWVSSSLKKLSGVVPMAFGNESFWTRYPTAAEEVTMTNAEFES